jgi:hypothetical protein
MPFKDIATSDSIIMRQVSQGLRNGRVVWVLSY